MPTKESTQFLERELATPEASISAETAAFLIKENDGKPIPVMTQGQARRVEIVNQRIQLMEKVPDVGPETFTVGGEVARGVGRAATGVASGVARVPRLALEILPGAPPPAAESIVAGVSDRFANFLDDLGTTGFLKPDPRADAAEGLGFVNNPQWWVSRFPEQASNAVAFLVPGAGASKLGRLGGLTRAQAARLGKRVSVSIAMSAEGGLTFNDMRNQLIAQGVPEDKAGQIAASGGLAYGLASGLLEAKLIDFLGAGTPGQNMAGNRFMRILRAGGRGAAGEITEEQSQLLAEAAVTATVSHLSNTDLERVLTAENIVQAGIAAGSAGAGFGVAGGSAQFAQETTSPPTAESVALVAETAGITEMQAQYIIGHVAEETQPTPTPEQSVPAKQSDLPVVPETPTVEPTAPTGQAQPDPAAPAVGATEQAQRVARQEAAEAKGAEIQRQSDQDRMQAIRRAESDALSRQKAKDSRVDDLKTAVAVNLPESLTKQQIKDFTQKINDATSPQRLRVVVRQVMRAEAKIQTKQAQNRLRDAIKNLNPQKLSKSQRESVQGMINGMDPKQLSPTKRAELEKLKQFTEREGGESVPPKVAAELKRLDMKPIAKMTRSEAEIAADFIEQKVSQSKKVQQIHQRRRTRTLEAFIEDAVNEINRPLSRTEVRALAVAAGLKSTAATNFVFSKSIGMDASTMESFIEMLSGSDSSQNMDVLFTQVWDARNNTWRRTDAMLDIQSDLIRSLGLSDTIETWLRPADNALDRGLREAGLKPDPGAEQIELPSGKTVELYKAERTDFLHQMMDPETRSLVVFDGVPMKLPGMKAGESITLTGDDVQAIIESATPDEMAIASQAFQIGNGQQAADMDTATLKSRGESIIRSDEHAPRKRADVVAQAKFTADELYSQAVDNVGIAKERNPNDKTKPIIVGDVFSRFNNWAHQSSAIIEMTDTMEQAMSVVNDPTFKASIEQRHGADAYKRLKSFYDAIVTEAIGSGGGRPRVGDRSARTLFNNFTKAKLGLRPQVAAYQAASVATMMTELEAGDVTSSLGAALDPLVTQEANAHSPFMRRRFEGTGSQLSDTTTEADRRTLKQFRTDGKAEALLMGMIRDIDNRVMRVIWASSKRQAMREGRTGDDLMRRTAQIAERVIRRTQPTFDSMSITGLAVDARTNEFKRLMNFFRSQRSKNVDMTKMAIIRGSRGQITRAEEAKRLALVNIAQPLYIASVKWITRLAKVGAAQLVANLIGGTIPEDDERDEEYKRVLADFSSATVGNFVFGDIIDVIPRILLDQRAFDAQLSPFSSTFSDASRGIAMIAGAVKSDDPRSERAERAAKGLIKGAETAATTFGIPLEMATDPLVKLYEMTRDEKPKKQERRLLQ